jgi:hypothetical protein
MGVLFPPTPRVMLLRKIGTELTGSALQGLPGGALRCIHCSQSKKGGKGLPYRCQNQLVSARSGQTDDVHCIAQHCCWRCPMPLKNCSFCICSRKQRQIVGCLELCGRSSRTSLRIIAKTAIDIATDIGRLLKPANSNNSVRRSLASERPSEFRGGSKPVSNWGRVEDD